MRSFLVAAFFMIQSAIGESGEIKVLPGESIQDAVTKSSPGDTIVVFPGIYHESVVVDKPSIKIAGVTDSGRWPILDGKYKLNDGIIASGSGFTVERLHIRNYKANGVTTQAADNVTIRHLIVEKTGIYGIYPTLGRNVVVEDNVTFGIADAGIYIGMCEYTDVRRNEAYDNVAGIEAENSHHVLIENNYVYRNTSGVLVFTLPELPRKSSSQIIVRNNLISDNNTANFGAKGSIVASVPPGTGAIVLAADDVVFENNIIRDNSLAGIVVAHHGAIPNMAKDPQVDPDPDRVKILQNLFVNNGQKTFADMLVWGRYLVKQVISSGIPDGADEGIIPKGGDVIGTKVGRDLCIFNPDGIKLRDAEHFAKCTDRVLVDVKTTMLVAAESLSVIQAGNLGEQTYAAICAGCHAMNYQLIGPPLREIQAKYKGKPEGIAKFARAPVKVRNGFPPMPPQAYLGDEKLRAVAEYILLMK
jgi:parallel beta-helix repeat protein